ncbi:MAG: HPr family phosphocarrier protein [Clostridia bacterium]|nr:HPr family phosphocarrier protein [Clostridia bacterium]
MVAKDFIIKNKTGLHMRPAQVLVSEMSKFSADVTIQCGEKAINAKSMMGLMAACIQCGARVTVICAGTDEQAALDKASEIMESGFGEEI